MTFKATTISPHETCKVCLAFQAGATDDHKRCACCHVLVGPKHETTTVDYFGRCRSCARANYDTKKSAWRNGQTLK